MNRVIVCLEDECQALFSLKDNKKLESATVLIGI